MPSPCRRVYAADGSTNRPQAAQGLFDHRSVLAETHPSAGTTGPAIHRASQIEGGPGGENFPDPLVAALIPLQFAILRQTWLAWRKYTLCRGTDVVRLDYRLREGAQRWLPSMSQVQSFYEGHSFYEGLTWRSVIEWISQGLREQYEVSKELPPELLTLVGKLDDSDWLFPSVGWQNDSDLLFG